MHRVLPVKKGKILALDEGVKERGMEHSNAFMEEIRPKLSLV